MPAELVKGAANMSPGLQLLLTIVATIFAVGTVVVYRDLIFEQPARPTPTRRRPTRSPASAASSASSAPAALPKPAPKQQEIISPPVSASTIAENDAEMLAFLAIAKLIQANMITETAALQTVFNVKPGSSRAYQDARTKLKQAQDRLSAEHKVISA